MIKLTFQLFLLIMISSCASTNNQRCNCKNSTNQVKSGSTDQYEYGGDVIQDALHAINKNTPKKKTEEKPKEESASK